MWRDPRMLRHSRPMQGPPSGLDLQFGAVGLPILLVALVLAVARPFGDMVEAMALSLGLVVVLLWVGAKAFPGRWLGLAIWQGVPTSRPGLLNPSFWQHLERRPLAYALFVGLIAAASGIALFASDDRVRPLLDIAIAALVISLGADFAMKRWPRFRWVVVMIAIFAAALVAVLPVR